MCAYDVLANNTDRKSGHVLLGPGDRIWGVDQGLCFSAEFKLRTVIWDFVGEPIPPDMPRLRVLPVVLAFGLLAAACSSDDQPSSTGPTGNSQVTAIMASVDLYAGDPQRVAIGMITQDNHFVSFGTVDLAFSMVGSAAEASSPTPGPTATATFVPTFGTPVRSHTPTVTNPNEGRGVYEAEAVTFDQPGFWVADVTADIEGMGTQTAQASFTVTPKPGLPAPGDPAMKTDTLTVDSKGVPKAAIDSRAANTGKIPDPELHEWTIAKAIAEHRPALVVFATPVFCVSRFCGPVVNMMKIPSPIHRPPPINRARPMPVVNRGLM